MVMRTVAPFSFQFERTKGAFRHARLKRFVGKPLMLDAELAEVWMRRYDDTPEWEVVVVRRGAESRYKCRDYDQAMKWARVECKSYRTKIMVERADPSEGARPGNWAQSVRRLVSFDRLVGGRIRATPLREDSQS